jgi:hypothetical protein
MKLHVTWFAVTALIVGGIPFTILFIWCATNGFGAEAVRLFESLHPSGELSIIANMDKTFSARIPGILINSIYIFIDCFIAGFAFSSLYNFLTGRFTK